MAKFNFNSKNNL